MSKDLPEKQPQSEEVDLGQLFKLIGNMFDRLFKSIGNLFYKLFLVFVWLVFFIKKHLVKFAIAIILGFSWGYYRQKYSSPIYKSYITVKQNYKTGENLYTSIAYYKDLVGEDDTKTLESALGISPHEAESIIDFDIQAVVSANDKLKNYNDYIKTLDSTLAADVKYEDFIENSEPYLNKYQQITIKAKERNNFKKVYEKIIGNISENEYFKREQEKDLDELKNQEETILIALEESDSLQNIYKKVLEKNADIDDQNSSQTSIRIDSGEDQNTTKEFDLYINDLQLRQKLVQNRRNQADIEYVVEIISSKQDSGTIDKDIEFLGLSLSKSLFYAFSFFSLTFLILIGIQFMKFLEKYKD